MTVLIKKRIKMSVNTQNNNIFNERIECKKCHSLLFKAKNLLNKSNNDNCFDIEIKCRKCGETNIL